MVRSLQNREFNQHRGPGGIPYRGVTAWRQVLSYCLSRTANALQNVDLRRLLGTGDYQSILRSARRDTCNGNDGRMMWWNVPVPEEDDDPLEWSPCPDCGAPMIDDNKKSIPYCPMHDEEMEYPW